jgi:hypothetical protein
MFLLLIVEQPSCQMMMHSRPHTPLLNALKKISYRMVLFCQSRLTCQSLSVPIFGVSICPFNYGIKDDFIPELTKILDTLKPNLFNTRSFLLQTIGAFA